MIKITENKLLGLLYFSVEVMSKNHSALYGAACGGGAYSRTPCGAAWLCLSHAIKYCQGMESGLVPVLFILLKLLVGSLAELRSVPTNACLIFISDISF